MKQPQYNYLLKQWYWRQKERQQLVGRLIDIRV
jgi:hypothetical protein